MVGLKLIHGSGTVKPSLLVLQNVLKQSRFPSNL